jgi:hypothetical protein
MDLKNKEKKSLKNSKKAKKKFPEFLSYFFKYFKAVNCFKFSIFAFAKATMIFKENIIFVVKTLKAALFRVSLSVLWLFFVRESFISTQSLLGLFLLC